MTRLVTALCAVLLLGFVAACTSARSHDDPIPEHETFSIASKILGEDRIINVYTPPQYADGQTRLPVVYMPDGGTGEDFPHIANTLAQLIDEGAIPPVMLVGIENTDRRRDLTPSSTTDYDKDYGPQTDGARAFRSFIADELIPEIERRYRTAEGRTIVGESAAGLFVVDTFVRTPELFDNYIAMDPSLWWDDHRIVRQAPATFAKMDATGKSLWFAGSDAVDIYTHTRALDGILTSGAPAGLRWTYVDSPGEQHSTIFRATKERAFKWALGPDREF